MWQEKPKYIVMLCRLFENKKPKCAPYWPENKGDTKVYGTVTVTNEGDGGKGNEQVFDIEKFRVSAEDGEIVVKQVRCLLFYHLAYFRCVGLIGRTLAFHRRASGCCACCEKSTWRAKAARGRPSFIVPQVSQFLYF